MTYRLTARLVRSGWGREAGRLHYSLTGVAVGGSANAIAVRQVGLSGVESFPHGPQDGVGLAGVVVLPVEVARVERPDEGAPQTHCVGVLGLDEGRLGVVVSDPVGAVGCTVIKEWSVTAFG